MNISLEETLIVRASKYIVIFVVNYSKIKIKSHGDISA